MPNLVEGRNFLVQLCQVESSGEGETLRGLLHRVSGGRAMVFQGWGLGLQNVLQFETSLCYIKAS